MDIPTEDELAAIVAAYPVLCRSAEPPPAPEPSRWRRAGRTDATTLERPARWRAAGRPA
jgi:hypothetical protein